MAIPFNLPTDEETEDNYRRLDQLLLDLYHLLRQILLRPRSENTNRDDGGGGEGGTAPNGSRPVGDVGGSRRHRLDPNLPDVVSSTLDCHCPASRRRQRRHRRRRNFCHNQVSREQNRLSQTLDTSTTSLSQVPRHGTDPAYVQAPQREENWLMVGEHLRMIAEEFKGSLKKEQNPKEKDKDLKLEVKTSGLFSLLVPSHFRNSLWTTVILLVGWRILVRTR